MSVNRRAECGGHANIPCIFEHYQHHGMRAEDHVDHDFLNSAYVYDTCGYTLDDIMDASRSPEDYNPNHSTGGGSRSYNPHIKVQAHRNNHGSWGSSPTPDGRGHIHSSARPSGDYYNGRHYHHRHYSNRYYPRYYPRYYHRSYRYSNYCYKYDPFCGYYYNRYGVPDPELFYYDHSAHRYRRIEDDDNHHYTPPTPCSASN